MRFKQFLEENHYGSLVDEDKYKSLDAADKALYKYTADGFTALGHVIDKLVKKYPYEGGTIYRGLHFDNQKEHDEFLKSIEDGTIKTTGTSSWAPHESTASDFTTSKKTYFPDLGIMLAHEKMQKEGEHMSGYGGVLIATTVKANVGVDVSKSDFAKESEVILKPGEYAVKIVKLAEPHKRKYGTPEAVSELIKRFAKATEKTDELDGLLKYVKKSWAEKDKLTTEQFDILVKYELMKFLKFTSAELKEKFSSVKIEKAFTSVVNKERKDMRIIVDIWIPIYKKGILKCSPELQAKITKQIKTIGLGAKVKITNFMNENAEHIDNITEFDIRGVDVLKEFDENLAKEISQPLRSILAKKYHELNSREVSKTLTDVWAIRDHGEKIAKIVDAMTKI